MAKIEWMKTEVPTETKDFIRAAVCKDWSKVESIAGNARDNAAYGGGLAAGAAIVASVGSDENKLKQMHAALVQMHAAHRLEPGRDAYHFCGTIAGAAAVTRAKMQGVEPPRLKGTASINDAEMHDRKKRLDDALQTVLKRQK